MNDFGKILATRLPNQDTNLDAGYLAELLLFYKRVNIIINKLMLDNLLDFCDLDTLYQLISSERLNIYIVENYIAGTQFEGNKFNIESFKIKNENYKNILYKALQQRLRNSSKTIKYQDKLLNFIKPYEISLELIPQIREEFKNEYYVKKCLETSINYNIKDYELPKDTQINFGESEPINERETFQLVTNFNFEEFNNSCEQLGLRFRLNPPSLLLEPFAKPKKNTF